MICITGVTYTGVLNGCPIHHRDLALTYVEEFMGISVLLFFSAVARNISQYFVSHLTAYYFVNSSLRLELLF